MNKSLYHISTEAKELVSALEENEGELNPAIEAVLRINQNELTEKSFSYAYVIKSEQDDISIAKEEIKRLQGIIKAKEKVVDRMKEAVVNAMSIYGIEKLSSPTLTLSIRRSEAVVVDEDFNDRNYMIEKITYTPDKKRIKEALLKGERFLPARIIENYNLQIK
jgi:hypothetical protein